MPLTPPMPKDTSFAQLTVDLLFSEPMVTLVMVVAVWVLCLQLPLAIHGRVRAVKVVYIVVSLVVATLLAWRLVVLVAVLYNEQSMPVGFGVLHVLLYLPIYLVATAMLFQATFVDQPLSAWSPELSDQMHNATTLSGEDAWSSGALALYAAYITSIGMGYDAWRPTNAFSRAVVAYRASTFAVLISAIVMSLALSFLDARNDARRGDDAPKRLQEMGRGDLSASLL